MTRPRSRDREQEGPEGWQAEDAPRVQPLTYPGRIPSQSVLLTSDDLLELTIEEHCGLEEARVEDPAHPGSSLDAALLHRDTAQLDDRVPVLAVGSNAAPAQMRHKFSVSGSSHVLPMVLAHLEGLAAGVAADVATFGYVPATPIFGTELTANLFVDWLDAHQLAALDDTEKGYDRVLLPAGDPANGGVRVTLPSGEVLGSCYAYVSTSGCLTRDGDPRLPESQPALLADLLSASADLRDLLGPSPETWIDRIGAPEAIGRAKAIFATEGWVLRQPL